MPKRKDKSGRWPCGICSKQCKTYCICCGTCNRWFHIECEEITRLQLTVLSDNSIEYICSSCCKDENGSFDVEASLNRLLEASKRSQQHAQSAAITEKIALRCLSEDSHYISNVSCKLSTDWIAMQILHKAGGIGNRRAVHVPGDGNCLFTAVSVALTGHTGMGTILRLRTAIELLTHRQHYTEIHRAKMLHAVSCTYEEACRDAVTISAYSSSWAIQALCSVIGRKIVSIYPTVNSATDTVARVLNTDFLPREQRSRKAIFIAWSSSMLPQPGRTWTPNHFVPLLDSPEDPIDLSMWSSQSRYLCKIKCVLSLSRVVCIISNDDREFVVKFFNVNANMNGCNRNCKNISNKQKVFYKCFFSSMIAV